MEFRGIKLKRQATKAKDNGFFELKPCEYYSVPLLADDGDGSARAVNIGEKVKEGSLIAKPVGKYGSFVYSPISGKVVSVVKKLNASGNFCEHVVIARDLSEEKEYLPPLKEFESDKENLMKRLYESGMVDNFEPFDPSYKKYLSKKQAKTFIVNCCATSDPYAKSSDALLENFLSDVFEGARFLAQISGALNIVFIFSALQKKLAKKVLAYIKEKGLSKYVKVKVYPNIYPLTNSRMIAYYETGKMVKEDEKTAEVGVVIDSVNNCYDFFHAVREGKPAIERAVTVSGNNCVRKANYFIKNGTPMKHILEVVGIKSQDVSNMLVYGGILWGYSQESLDTSVTLTASTILFCDGDEFIAEEENPCINCGKCLEVCPVKLHVKKLDQAFSDQRFGEAKRLHVDCCIGCGACSFACPAKRNLAQRVKYMKDFVIGKRAKKPDSSEYVLVDGLDLRENSNYFDKILEPQTKFEKVTQSEEQPEINKMFDYLESQTKEGGKKDE